MTRTYELRGQERRTMGTEEPAAALIHCNGCGDQIPTRVRTCYVRHPGGYASPILSDLTTYAFDLCETCLVRIMDGLRVPPTLIAPMRQPIDGPELTYADDRRGHAAHLADMAARERAVAEARARGVCSWVRADSEQHELCGGIPVGTSDGVPTCLSCLRNDFGMEFRHDWPELAGLTPAMASRISRRELVIWQAGGLPSGSDAGLLVSEIQSATALVLLGKDPALACRVLEAICDGRPPRVTRDRDAYAFHSLPTLFTPSVGARYLECVSDWLYWGRSLGFLNAVAAVSLRTELDDFWMSARADVEDAIEISAST